jgi:20S proteasome alpha/beta subunit
MCSFRTRTGYSFDLSDEDAIDLGRRSIYAAGHRDVRVFSLSGRCP